MVLVGTRKKSKKNYINTLEIKSCRYLYIEIDRNMILNKLTNETYPNRQEAKRIMGHAAFNKAVKRGDLEYIVSTHKQTDIII